MRNGQRTLIAAAIALLACAAMALAHHGSVEYDQTSVTLQGTVTHFEWSNPHCVLSFAVRDDRGVSRQWNAEILPPTQMVRAGWTRKSVKAGDQVELTGRPGRNGERIMWLEYLVTSDGRKFGRDLGAH